MPIRRFLDRVRGISGKDAPAQRLADVVIARARMPWFYAQAHVPDTLEGRFAVVVLHLWMLTKTLRSRGGWGVELAQDAFDAVLDRIERGLREAGVGDIAIPKRLAKLTRIFHGHAKAFDRDLEAADPAHALGETLKRNLSDAGSLRVKEIGDWAFTEWQRVNEMSDEPLQAGADPFGSMILEGAAKS